MIYLSKEGMYAKIKQKMETLGTFFCSDVLCSRSNCTYNGNRCTGCEPKTALKQKKGKSYYYQNGQKVKGWLTLNGKKYFF